METVMHLERQGSVWLLRMTAGDNRFNRSFVDQLNAALDEIEAAGEPGALVTTGEGKFYSNGLDLDWLSTGAEEMGPFVVDVEKLFARVLTAPVITVAALNGHVFAAGAMLALCHDFRVMRADRGFFCLPEVDIKIPFSPGMNALIHERMPYPVRHEAMVTGKRYGGEEAARRQIVDLAVAEDEVLPRAMEAAGSLADKDPAILSVIKTRMYAPVVELLTSSTGTRPLS